MQAAESDVVIVILMGVSGAGKSTVGRRLAETLRAEFHEGDGYHTEGSREKMRHGIALTDADREPWLAALRELIDSIQARGADAVITCSALKRSYRERLRAPGVQIVYLKASPEVLESRLRGRKGHFFSPELLPSQLATLEEPKSAIVVDADQPVEAVVAEIAKRLGRSTERQ